MPGLPLNPVSLLGQWGVECPSDVSVSSTAAALPAPALLAAKGLQQVTIQNDTASGQSIRIGDATRQTLTLAAGGAITFPIADPTKCYVSVASGSATVHLIYCGPLK